MGVPLSAIIGMVSAIKKYSKTEIAAKLAQANDLAGQGKLMSEIARTLGVSVMTLHRWHKLPIELDPTPIQQSELARFEGELGSDQGIAKLQSENTWLRRLVTDLLLEIVELKESAPPPPGKARTE
jgi:putative transposase